MNSLCADVLEDVVCFLLGNSLASDFHMPTFCNTHCLFHLHRPMKMEQTECSEMLAYKIHTPRWLPCNHA